MSGFSFNWRYHIWRNVDVYGSSQIFPQKQEKNLTKCVQGSEVQSHLLWCKWK